ncbi:MIP/aquaporin family protein [Clostridium sp. Mt-5]|uniref:MIP/aquaporin family protein n=1 Tax=Clostridium moutaii TaxID=3240932 RepID=A0ABV4BVM5_9CLOT
MSHYLAEFIGTAILIFLGDGVCANITLNKSKSQNAGSLFCMIGWSLAVGVPALIFGGISGAHFNPALTIAFAAIGKFPWAEVPGYVVSQMLGGFIGAVLVWIHYLPHWAESKDIPSEVILSIFCTTPAIRNYTMNFISEFMATFILVFTILGVGAAKTADGVGTVFVAFIILVIGTGLGGTTGFAINPARDLSPRIAHALLPINGKNGSDWAYSWIPVIAPVCGGIAAAGMFAVIF